MVGASESEADDVGVIRFEVPRIVSTAFAEEHEGVKAAFGKADFVRPVESVLDVVVAQSVRSPVPAL